MTDEQRVSFEGAKSDSRSVTDDRWNTYSPVTVSLTETVGVLFLGIIAVALLISLLRALARNRDLEVEFARRFPIGSA